MGDIFLANLPLTKGFGLGEKFISNKKLLVCPDLKQINNGSNITFANLESPLSYDENIARNDSFLGHSSAANFLRAHNINVLSIANNHI